MTAAEKFWNKVDLSDPGGCWMWVAACTRGGYGHFQLGGRWVRAHRFSYEALVGPIPPGLQIDHLCRVRACVNPAHLEPVTCRENLLRGDTLTARNAAKTHCPQGHSYDEANTYIRSTGGRNCRACDRDSARRRRAGTHDSKDDARFGELADKMDRLAQANGSGQDGP